MHQNLQKRTASNCGVKMNVVSINIIIILSGLFQISFGQTLQQQDTIFFDSKQEYFSKNGDSVRFDKAHKFKGYPRVKYSREIIRISKNKYKIDYCYYYNNKRYSNNSHTFFEFENDSVLITPNEKWIYKTLNDSLISVYKADSEYFEKGTVTSLIPFIKHGEFVTINKSGKKILTDYYQNGQYLKTYYPKIILSDSVYTKAKSLPKFPERYGNLTEYIAKRAYYPGLARENSIEGRVYIRFVVTSQGKNCNFEVLRGIDPILDKEALKVVANLPDFEPVEIDGKKVNTFFIVPIKFSLR